MRKILVMSLLVAMAAGAAYANYCARDNVPAAALLVPFAQVGVNANNDVNPQGKTTFYAITNVSNEAIIVHNTLWNAYSQHVLDFDVILTGYDVIQMDLREVINGNLLSLEGRGGTKFTTKLQITGLDYTPFELGPEANTTGRNPSLLPDPQDRNVFSATPGCGKFPYQNYGAAAFACVRDKLAWPLYSIVRYQVDQLVTPILGGVSNNWLVPDNVQLDNLYFYVTSEVVRECSTLFPSDQAYWAPVAFPTYHNDIIGDVVFLDAANNFSEAMSAVSIEGDVDSGTAMWHYYDRYATDFGARSYFEPLATAFGFRYNNTPNNPIAITTNLLFWKSRTEFDEHIPPFAGCDGEDWLRPDAIDNTQGYSYYAWDMDEFPIATGGSCPVSPCNTPQQPNVLPFEVQRVPITANNFDLPADTGWMLLVLPPSLGGAQDIYNTPAGPAAEGRTVAENIDNRMGAMGWAAVQFTIIGQGSTVGYSALIDAAVLGNRHCFNGPLFVDQLPILNTYNGGVPNGVVKK